MANKLYFRTENDELAWVLESHLREAKENGLKKVTLIEAVPDTINNDMTWCTLFASAVEKKECKKSCCEKYESNKSGRGTCINRGKLYLHGEPVEFDVS
jgi:hypothetical protein